eukprot:TRINITY_DN187_c2_g1_i1.p1 TRINITY_DN187_c2_g1~~TRINITY_DN187_c2_g1_i1.p1  ORF type:complete len:86 (-),score=12.81 TRINITY_DN187_c2_g1_i1:64-321(-)
MSICHQYQNPLEFLSSAAIEFEEQEMLCKYLLESKNKEEEQSKKKTSKKGVCLDYIERKGKIKQEQNEYLPPISKSFRIFILCSN